MVILTRTYIFRYISAFVVTIKFSLSSEIIISVSSWYDSKRSSKHLLFCNNISLGCCLFPSGYESETRDVEYVSERKEIYLFTFLSNSAASGILKNLYRLKTLLGNTRYILTSTAENLNHPEHFVSSNETSFANLNLLLLDTIAQLNLISSPRWLTTPMTQHVISTLYNLIHNKIKQ